MKRAPELQTDTAQSLATQAREAERLREENEALKRRLAWLENQIFGQKSEKRPVDPALQPSLLGEPGEPAPAEGEQKTFVPGHERGKAKKNRPEDCVNDAGLRFGPNVPVEVITLTPPELQGSEAHLYEIIGTKSTFRIAQRPASYVVLQYDRPVIKRKDEEQPLPSPAPINVLDRSVADVSFLVGLLVDKFQFHLPLYRQHQRLTEAGITLSRATLSNLVKRAIDLLRPIVAAQLDNVLMSRVLAMDETPIKAGPAKKPGKGRGKMQQGWFWPLYGDGDEVVFTYSASRGRQHIETVLRERFSGTLLSDGYKAYASYVEKSEHLTHAQCWVHSRRQFIEAEADEPALVAEALAYIRKLYEIEDDIKAQELSGGKKREYRLTHSQPLVNGFFEWCQEQLAHPDRLPKDPFTKALGYVIAREHPLRVFLEEPDVQMDTNHLERALRPIPMGRKNWMFCWTELGAEHVGIIQSLITTCKLQDVNAYTYLTDVLLRINEHPANDVHDLTPRVWKEKFGDNPLRSDLYAAINHSVE